MWNMNGKKIQLIVGSIVIQYHFGIFSNKKLDYARLLLNFERMFESREFQSFCGTGAYCCSGVNHGDGNGPVSNGDCPLEAILAVTSVNHVCLRNEAIGN